MIFREARILVSNVGQHAGIKLACHAAVGAWIALFYYGPQLWPLFPARSAPLLAIDHWVPFQPVWALAYQSVFIVHTLALWLPRDPEAVKRYARNLVAVFACGAVVFWLYPTLSPRPAQSGSSLHYWLISAVDGPRNAFPSLHAAMGLLAAAAVLDHLRACRVSRSWRVALALWWIASLYSTLATRQHRLLDLLAGICLGLISSALPPLTIHTSQRHDRFPTSPNQSPVL
jgi:membrane-associated phospholipid phosphatase